MNYWRWLEMRIPVDDFVTEALPAPWPCGLPYATPAPCAVWLAREPPPAPPLPCVLEGRSWGTDLPRLLLSGFVCLNFALLAMLPATGYVCIRPKKLCFEPAGLLAPKEDDIVLYEIRNGLDDNDPLFRRTPGRLHSDGPWDIQM